MADRLIVDLAEDLDNEDLAEAKRIIRNALQSSGFDVADVSEY